LKRKLDGSQRQWNACDLARMVVQANKEAAEENQKCQGRNERLSVAEHEDEEQQGSGDTTGQRAAQLAEVIRACGLSRSLYIVEGDWVVAILPRRRFRLIG
jgi:hypothetical protein